VSGTEQLSLDDLLDEDDGMSFGEWVESLPVDPRDEGDKLEAGSVEELRSASYAFEEAA
jgi:hypothetical protein